MVVLLEGGWSGAKKWRSERVECGRWTWTVDGELGERAGRTELKK
jgi:hypothetical protein